MFLSWLNSHSDYNTVTLFHFSSSLEQWGQPCTSLVTLVTSIQSSSLVDLCSMSMGKRSGLTELVLCLWIVLACPWWRQHGSPVWYKYLWVFILTKLQMMLTKIVPAIHCTSFLSDIRMYVMLSLHEICNALLSSYVYSFALLGMNT